MMRPTAQYGRSRKRWGGLPLVAAVLLAMLWGLMGPAGAQSARAPAAVATPAAVAAPAVATPVAAPPLPLPPTGQMPSEAPSQSPATVVVAPVLPRMPTVQGAEIDRVVAIVNGELILDSDVDQERRFAALLPYGEANGPYNRAEAIARLVNRDLILQQSRLQPGEGITMAAAAKDLDALRKSIPSCKENACETQAGWERFLATEGFNPQSLTNLWRQRMEVLAFIEQRFRMGIKISQEEVQTYYEKTMLPEYAERHATPPPVDAISSRIQQVLLQQQVSKLLDDWLQSLRAQGNVVVLHPGEEAP